MLYPTGFAVPNITPPGFAVVIDGIVSYSNTTPSGFTGLLKNKQIALDYPFAKLKKGILQSVDFQINKGFKRIY